MDYFETGLRNKNCGYSNLIVWQTAMELFEMVWKIAYQESKIAFKLRAQFADAAQSISSNSSGSVVTEIGSRGSRRIHPNAPSL
jgi:23S rRNA-intervening sequence protein